MFEIFMIFFDIERDVFHGVSIEATGLAYDTMERCRMFRDLLTTAPDIGLQCVYLGRE